MTSANPPVSTEAVNRHLEKLLQSSAMAKSWSLSRLLKFLVARALDGTAGELKEHTLGVEVFDRGPDFDPRTDNIVRVQVRNLRARLVDYYAGDGQHEPIRIDLPKGAYIIEFKQILETESAAALPAPRWWAAVKNKIWLVTAAAAVGLIVVAAVVFWELRHTRPTEVAPQNHVIAVLPFTDLDRNPGTEYFTDGLTEELINSLTQLDGLSVIARYSSFQFRGSNPNLQSVAEQLKATEVVEGSVRRQGSGIRVSVRLVSVPSGKTIWSREYDRVLKDAVRTEEDIANGVSAALRLKLSTAPRKAAAPNEEAHDLYLKGRYYWDKVDPLYSKKAMEFFTQAIAIDPNYSAPYVGLAGAYGTQAVWHAEPPRQKWPKIDRKSVV